ncbi:uncharacterized protein [Haliotis cracherodii]|uniref:uncharacterized protein isoform X2 n=1 Tax=Haliotis cracherodii TaxID=6455 RepID=UPI0039EB8BD1
MSAPGVYNLDHFRAKVEAVCKIARDDGMTATGINQCLDQSLGAPDAAANDGLTVFTRWMWCNLTAPRLCLFSVVSALFLAVSPAGHSVLGLLLPQDVIANGMVAVLKFARLSSVPFHGMIDFSNYYSSECFVNNPLYVVPEPECDTCKNHKSVKELKVKIKTLKLHLMSYPLIHRGLQTPVHLEDVEAVIRKEKDHLVQHPIDCTAGWAVQASDLVREELLGQIEAEKNFSCVWNSKEKMFLGQLMRRLFPRPSIIPHETEIALQKYLYIDGVGGKQRTLPPSSQGGYSWYAQGQGTRKVVFNSPEACVDTCNTFQITLKEGDILTFPSWIWTVNVEENGEEISVGFLGHILP